MEEARDTRKLAAIMVADVVGYSRLVAANESGTLARLRACLSALIHPAISERTGRIFKTTGDGFLASFDSAIDAVECAVVIQRRMAERAAHEPPEERIVFRIGINVGDVVVEGDDLQGGGVNVAARLEAAATPGGITISGTVYDHVRDRLQHPIENLGEISVKNIPYPIRAYRVHTSDDPARRPSAPRRLAPGTTSQSRGLRVSPALIGLALVAMAGVLAVWRPWATPPELLAAADSELPPAQQAAAAAGQILSPRLPRAPSSERNMLLVLPFTNQSGDPEQSYFSDGVTEDVINSLARIAGFTVIARNTAFTFKGKAVNAQTVGQELGVRYLLEGSIQRQGDRLRLNAQLVDTTSGNTVWAERFDRRMADVFVVQDELADRIVGTVATQLRRREGQRALAANPETLDALDLTLRARQLRGTSNRDEIIEARRMLERAIALDPRFVPAYTLLYGVMNQFFINRWTAEFNSPATTQAMLDLAGKAVSIAPSDPMARATYAESLTLVGQHGTAVAQIESVVSNTSADTDLLRLAATVFARAGEFERSVAMMKRVLQLDPATTPGNLASPLASSLYLQGKYAEAADYAGQCVRRAPSNILCRRWFIASLAQLGKLEDARREVAEMMALSPGLTISEQSQRMARSYRDPEHVRHHAEGLKKAGVPE
jgi:TolB-like protein/class 3 adenylate cyclase/Tfp pilus assembly protein PilF